MSRCRMQRAPERRGLAILVMVVLMLMLSLVIIGMVGGGARDQDLVIRRLETARAFYASEGGMNMAIREMVNNADEDGDGGTGSISDDSNNANNPSIGPATVLVTATVAGNETTITSTATLNQTNRRTESTMTQATGGSYAGLAYSFYASATNLSQLSDVNWSSSPATTGVVSMLNQASSSGAGWPAGQTNNWGKRFSGKVAVPQAGTWTFYTTSDEGSKLWINGALVVNNDGLHTMTTGSGSIALAAGTHDIVIQWFERTGEHGLVVSWSGPGVPTETVIPASAFTH